MIYMITAYEIFAIIGFLIIANQHESLTILSFFSVIVITLAIYIIPNKLLYSQIASILLSISFFMIYAKNIEGMDLSVLWKIFSYNVIIIIYCNISAYITGFYKRKQFIYSKELLRVSVTDPLTGIYNRGKFNEELNFWIDYYNRYENSLSIVLIDIDDFKKVNDIYGHIVGDRVIQSIVNTIKKSVRNTDIFARWGGEEFVLLLPNTDMQQAKEMMERLRINIQNNRHDKVDRITCSFGLAVFRQNDNAESLLQRVDKLLYKAKKTGKNIVVYEFK